MAPRARRGGEIESLKARIAEAFVEAIFRRAGFRVSRADRGTDRGRPLRIGPDEFLPLFELHALSGDAGVGRRLHRRISIDVKYRPSVEEFLRTSGPSLTPLAARWPALHVVLVTDHPAAGRSCFQILDLREGSADGVPASVDLHHVTEFDVYATTVQEYEGLVRQIFPLLRLGGPLAPFPA